MKISRPYLAAALALVVLAAAGCKSDNLPTTPTQQTGLVGSWRWVSSYGGFVGHRITPESEGYTQRHIFGADSSFTWYLADTVMLRTTWSAYRMKPTGWTDSLDVIDFPEGTMLTRSYSLDDDTLRMEDYMVGDGYSYVFVRER